MELTPEYFKENDAGRLPDVLGLKVTHVGKGEFHAEFEVAEKHLAINGYLHAGSVVTLADTAAGYGCFANLPEAANGFTTIELKMNLLSTAREGKALCVAKCVHAGRTTQVWESTVTSSATGKTMAKFTCTQLVLYPRNL